MVAIPAVSGQNINYDIFIGDQKDPTWHPEVFAERSAACYLYAYGLLFHTRSTNLYILKIYIQFLSKAF